MEISRDMSHVTGNSTKGIVTPTKYQKYPVPQKKCACGIDTSANVCALCSAEMKAGISLRVLKSN